jgi:hypothetical protein
LDCPNRLIVKQVRATAVLQNDLTYSAILLDLNIQGHQSFYTAFPSEKRVDGFRIACRRAWYEISLSIAVTGSVGGGLAGGRVVQGTHFHR